MTFPGPSRGRGAQARSTGLGQDRPGQALPAWCVGQGEPLHGQSSCAPAPDPASCCVIPPLPSAVRLPSRRKGTDCQLWGSPTLGNLLIL